MRDPVPVSELERRREEDHGEPDAMIFGELHNRMCLAEKIMTELLTYVGPGCKWSTYDLRNSCYLDPRWTDVSSTSIGMALRRMVADGVAEIVGDYVVLD